MADGTTGGGLPSTFGAKLSYMAGPLVLTLVVAVAIAFGIVWIWAGKIDERMKQEHGERVAAEKTLTDGLAATNTDLAKAKTEITGLNKQVAQLQEEKKRLDEALTVAQEKLDKAVNLLNDTTTALSKFKDEQKTVDSQQGAAIADNSRRIQYIEEKIKRLDVIEDDVKKLFAQDDEMQRSYVALRKELTVVRDRGAVTEEQLNGLSERTRVFQLRVLAARAKQAADAAREGDLKQLLSRLTD